MGAGSFLKSKPGGVMERIASKFYTAEELNRGRGIAHEVYYYLKDMALDMPTVWAGSSTPLTLKSPLKRPCHPKINHYH
eukprot:611020-Pelagomonas_calceolata.AAC.2